MTETYSGVGWHFFYFAYDKAGWNQNGIAYYRNYYFRVGRVSDTNSMPTLHVYEDYDNQNLPYLPMPPSV